MSGSCVEENALLMSGVRIQDGQTGWHSNATWNLTKTQTDFGYNEPGTTEQRL